MYCCNEQSESVFFFALPYIDKLCFSEKLEYSQICKIVILVLFHHAITVLNISI